MGLKDARTKQRFIEMRAAGLSYAKIAADLKVSKQTLITWSRDLQVEIANAKAIELDALQRRLHLNAEGRLELFGTMLDRLKAEFLKRDLAALPLDKLIEQMAKLTILVANESANPMFWQRRYKTLGSTDIDSFLSAVDDHWPA